ncbi:ATP-binding cassette domain-containing protein [Corallincola platygyrae]|uniref:ATP-binding cassette domain-containing protein n=1 Tax=Corallincola platygyrae TaxID=1193278 RepID=A0ABW4XQA4_9GAMM
MIHFLLYKHWNNLFSSQSVELASTGITGIYGRSGEGKSTLLRWLAGLESLEGQIEFFGECWQRSVRTQTIHGICATGLHEDWAASVGNAESAAGAESAEHAESAESTESSSSLHNQHSETQACPALKPELRQLGYVPQHSALFSHLTVIENLKLAKPFPNPEIASLEQLIDLLSLRSLLDRPVAVLSGGERQRVALARAICVRPSALLLDEPFSAIDEGHRHIIASQLKIWAKKLPVILVSHAQEELGALCDKVLILDKGAVVAQGQPGDVFSRPDLLISHRDNAASILMADFLEYDHNRRLRRFMVEGQPMALPMDSAHWDEGGQAAEEGRVALRLLHRDMILSRGPLTGTSLRNGFEVTVLALHTTAESQVLVRLGLGEQKLLARITQCSAEELRLSEGEQIYAYVKAVSLVTHADALSPPMY